MRNSGSTRIFLERLVNQEHNLGMLFFPLLNLPYDNPKDYLLSSP
jgi:hypothetical protein